MGRSFAGTLGPLAMILIIVKGFRNASGVEATLWSGVLALVVMASVGYLLGELAAWVVEDSVRTKIANEIAAWEAKQVAGSAK